MPLRSSRLRALAAFALCLVAAACADRSDAAIAGSPSPRPDASVAVSPSPTPAPPAPVDGDVELTAIHLESAGQKLYSPGSPGDQAPQVDEAAVHDFVGGVDRWLDTHLTAVQAGELPELPALGASDAHGAAAAVTSDLTSPAAPVAAARYTTEVAIDDGPRWAHVTVTVTRIDGSEAVADFVFAPTESGPELIAAGPAGEVDA